MALARGRKADRVERPGRVVFAFGRLVGFVMVAGAALAILAAVVLLPAYAEMATAQYEQDLERAHVADMEAFAAANDRLIGGLESEDAVLTKRLAARQLGLWPRNEAIAMEAKNSAPASLIHWTRHPRPDPPSGWLIGAAARLRSPGIRRGLLALAGAAMLAAVLAFSSPEKYRRNRKLAARGDAP